MWSSEYSIEFILTWHLGLCKISLKKWYLRSTSMPKKGSLHTQLVTTAIKLRSARPVSLIWQCFRLIWRGKLSSTTRFCKQSVSSAFVQPHSVFDVLISTDFLDHLMRETPSKKFYALRRSYFHPSVRERLMIGCGVEAIKGVYQSIRAAQVL